jgi:thioredoxin-like negative regulator of GroEL
MKYLWVKIVLFTVAVCLIIHNHCIAESPVYTDSLIDAMVESENTKMPILVVFTADWCKYCPVLKKDIEQNLSTLENTIICYVDYDKNLDLAKEYQISVLPTCLLMQNQKEHKKIIGYKGFHFFKQWLLK